MQRTSGDGALSADERHTLEAVLDALVPPSAERGMPGAGELGLAPEVARTAAASEEAAAALRAGLEACEEAARRRGAEGFAALDSSAREQVLREVDASRPDFVGALLFPTYSLYYRHPRVLERLGPGPRPPHPGGYSLDPFEPALLEPVRHRSPFYRRV